jgi:hypothetical protein
MRSTETSHRRRDLMVQRAAVEVNVNVPLTTLRTRTTGAHSNQTTVDGGEIFTGRFAPDKEEVLATECHHAQRCFASVVVDGDARMSSTPFPRPLRLMFKHGSDASAGRCQISEAEFQIFETHFPPPEAGEHPRCAPGPHGEAAAQKFRAPAPSPTSRTRDFSRQITPLRIVTAPAEPSAAHSRGGARLGGYGLGGGEPGAALACRSKQFRRKTSAAPRGRDCFTRGEEAIARTFDGGQRGTPWLRASWGAGLRHREAGREKFYRWQRTF